MINTNERRHSTEMPHNKEILDTAPDTYPTLAQVEQVFAQREEMLFFIKADIGASLYDALYEKAEHENTFLLAVIEDNAKVMDAKKLRNEVLKTEYFVQKSLDINTL